MNWAHPDQPNGVIERYLLYVSEDPLQLGQIAYNSSDLFLYYIMEELSAGTTFFVRVSVSSDIWS